MNLDNLHYLLSADGQHMLAEIQSRGLTEENHIRVAESVRRRCSATQTYAILETVSLRQKGQVKFSLADQMYFTRAALEQSSSELVGQYRSRRFAALKPQRVADLGCGIGADSIALAAVSNVVGIEWDPLRLAMAQENLRVHQRAERFSPLQADITLMSPIAVDAVFADPGRRDDRGRRFYSVEHYSPPLAAILNWREMTPNLAVKIGPGVAYNELPNDCETEFLSVGGGVKEAILWFGDLRSSASRRATLLPSGANIVALEQEPDVPITPPGRYLLEPDGAVIRAHLVRELAQQLGATMIDSTIAYLTSDNEPSSPFVTVFQVEDVFPFQLKRLRSYLRERQIGRAEIKKRGSALDPDALRKQLRLQGEHEAVVFLTRARTKPIVIIARRVRGAT